MHTPDAAQQILSEMANWNLKKVNFWCVDEGALSPMTPINPYLGGNAHKKNGPLFNCQSICAHFGITSLELNMAPGVLLEPYMSQGGQGVAETPIVSKGLSKSENCAKEGGGLDWLLLTCITQEVLNRKNLVPHPVESRGETVKDYTRVVSTNSYLKSQGFNSEITSTNASHLFICAKLWNFGLLESAGQ